MASNYDLSILIPARNEQFLAKTVENILQNKRGRTQIIIGLDGQWSDPPIKSHPDIVIFYTPVSIGQRAITNQCARLSNAKWLMKVDAHCAFDEGFDVKMLDGIKDHWTVVPIMYNLHAFDWVCSGCGSREYQGPSEKYKQCSCGGTRTKEIIWKPRWNRKSITYRFDKTLHFQYWGDFKKRPEAQGEFVPSLSLQGSLFMLTREKYWELNICDENHGSWGQQGTEVALKTWLSGGEVMVNTKTWYSHMFRTQGGDFSFPYRLTGREVEKARKYSREQFLEGKWKGKYTLSEILDRFYPVPDWHNTEVSKQIVFYTDNTAPLKIAHKVKNQLNKANISIISVSLKPMSFGDKNIHIKEPRGYLTMARQILAGLEASTADIIYLCEHDVLYHPSHFDFVPPTKDAYYYNTNVWRVRANDGHALYCDDLKQLSGLCAYRETLLKHFRERVKRLEQNSDGSFVRAMGFEPGTHGRPERIDDIKAESYKAPYPNLDIRHDNNLTPSRWRKEQFKNERYTKGWKESTLDKIEGWNLTSIV